VYPDPSGGVSAAEAMDLVRSGAMLLDVREDDEWEAGHAPGAVHVAMSELAGRVSELPSERTIVCVCHVGARSAMVAAALSDAGWDAVNLAGGMEAWVAAGLPLADPAAG
jgi:rhodanese-related sulfurtransferase